MVQAAIQVDRLTKRYGAGFGLDDLSFTVAPGECFALAGINGAGKTTLIRCLLDFTTPSSGRLLIHGRPHGTPAARADLAYLPERFTPPWFLTGRGFLRYGAALYRNAWSEAEALELLDALQLQREALEKPVRLLSKGMTQKLGLAACLLSAKQLYILDEPLSGLDPLARVLVRRQLLRRKQAGHTLFFTSHALPEIESLCDRMAILHGGKLRFAGNPAELRRQHGTDDLEEAFLRCIQ